MPPDPSGGKILIRGGTVLTDPHEPPRRSDVLVDGGEIARVGEGLEAAPGTELLDATDPLVMPGLVNAHYHTHNSLARGAIDGLPLELWLLELGARAADRSPIELSSLQRIGAIEMAKTGTTCTCDWATVMPWPTDEALGAIIQAYRDVGLRVSFARQVADRAFIDSFPALRDLLPAASRVRVGIAVSIMTLGRAELLDACRELVDRRGVTFQTHLSKTKATAGVARIIYRAGPAAKLRAVGPLGPNTLLAHCVWLEDDELDANAEAGSSISHNPVSNLKLGTGIAPLRIMRDRGCNVALGTDGSASSDNQNLFGAAASERTSRSSTCAQRTSIHATTRRAVRPRRGRPLVEHGPRRRAVIVRDGAMRTMDEAALPAEADEIGERVTRDAQARLESARQLRHYVRQVATQASVW